MQIYLMLVSVIVFLLGVIVGCVGTFFMCFNTLNELMKENKELRMEKCLRGDSQKWDGG